MSLYPQLQPNPETFRLNKIGEIQQTLQKEVEERRKLYKKYQRAICAIDGTGIGLNVISLGAGMAGVGLLAGMAIVAPILIPLEIAAITLCVFSTLGTIVNKRLAVKCKKHYEIAVIAETKLNTITSHVSKALQDNSVTDEEFTLILNELDKYNELKTEVRNNSSKKHDVIKIDEKKFLEEGIKQGRAQIIDQLKGVGSDVK